MSSMQLPFYLKFTVILMMLGLLATLIILGQDILVPIAFSILLSILILPGVQYLENKKFGPVSSISITLAVAIILIGLLVYFLSIQIIDFLDDTPTIKLQLKEHYRTLQKWIRTQFKISIWEQDQMVTHATGNLKDKGVVIGQTFFSATKSILVVTLLPVYSFLILYYRKMIKRFLVEVFDPRHEHHVVGVLNESKSIVQNYMSGLMIELAIVAVINIAGFFLVGIKYAIFLGLLAAILNMIPYIGMLIATIFCMAVTLTTSHYLADIFWVAGVLMIVQFIDNNIIMPRVVSNKVKINALVSIIGVLVGGALAGVSGMFLSIPGIAILKAIFERVDSLKAWSIILGDEITGSQVHPWMQRVLDFRKAGPEKLSIEIPEDGDVMKDTPMPTRNQS